MSKRSLEPASLFRYIAIIMKGKGPEKFFPWIILLLALIIRFWGINFSLPFIYHVDEERFAQIALNYLRGDLNPHFFHVPSLYTYSVAGLWKLYYLLGHYLGLGGKFASDQAFIDGFGRNPTVYMLLGRSLTVILSVATILALYFLGKYLAGPWTGFLAALALIFSPEHNKISHYLVPDSPMVLFLILSYYYIFKIYKEGRIKHYLLSGLFAGLAFTTKYGGHFLVIPLFLAHFFHLQESRKKWWDLSRHFPLLLWGVTFLLIFFLGTPYALLDYQTFWRDFRWQSSHLFSLGHFGSSTSQPAWLFYLQYGFAENAGFLLQFLVYAGIIFLLLKPAKRDLILLSFPLILFIIMGFWKTRATRYLLNLAPFFILIGVMGYDRLIQFSIRLLKLPHYVHRPGIQKSMACIFLVLLLPSIWKVARFNFSLTQEDTRTVAKHWIEANIPPGTRIALESYCPQISRKRYRVTYRHALYQADLDWLARRRIDYLIVSDIMSARFTRFPREFPEEAEFYQSLEEKAVLVKTFEPSWNEYLIDLHNPTIKIYRLSRRPDPAFPGFFTSYSQKIRLKAESERKWEISTSFKAKALIQSEELIRNLYIRGVDKKGREIFFWAFYPGNVRAGEEVALVSSEKIPALRPGDSLYLGYEIRFLRQPLFQNPESFFRQEMKLDLNDDAWTRQLPLELVFVYQMMSGERGEDYFQKILLWRQKEEWQLRATIYGGELRWGNDEVLNPWIEISDLKGLEKQKIILFSGWLGSTERATRAPVKIEKKLGAIPYPFSLSLGYDFYQDADLAQKAGGPGARPVELPPDWDSN